MSRAVQVALLVSALSLALLFGLTSISTDRRASAEAIDPDDPAQVALGREVYAAECASCHGADLEGEPDWQSRGPDGTYPAPPHDETGHTWHHDDALLVDYTKRGGAAVIGDGFESDMPGFADRLSEAEIRAVIAFIKSTWPDRVRELQEERNRG